MSTGDRTHRQDDGHDDQAWGGDFGAAPDAAGFGVQDCRTGAHEHQEKGAERLREQAPPFVAEVSEVLSPERLAFEELGDVCAVPFSHGTGVSVQGAGSRGGGRGGAHSGPPRRREGHRWAKSERMLTSVQSCSRALASTSRSS